MSGFPILQAAFGGEYVDAWLQDWVDDDDLAKGGPRLAVLDLSKAKGPPGKGWQRIPKGRKGGYRKPSGRAGRKWDYWYPGQPQARSKHGWELVPGGKAKDVGAGGLAFVGASGVLYRHVPTHGPRSRGETWVQGVESGRMRRVKRSALQPVRRRRAPKKVPAPPPVPKKDQDKGPGYKAPSRRRAVVFKESRANKKRNPVLWNIENGKYHLQRHKDADRRRSEWGIYLPPGHERQFFEEFRGQIIGAARAVATSFGIRVRDHQGHKTVAYDNLLSAATMGLVMSLSTYTGGRPFAPRAWDYCLSYTTNQARTEMGAGAHITTRQMSMLKGWLAAKARAYDRLANKRAPTLTEIAREWTVLKSTVFHGKMGSYVGADGKKRVQGQQKIPMNEWFVKDKDGHPVGKPQKGLLQLAETMQAMAQGSKVHDSEWFITHGTSAPEVEAQGLALGEQLRRRDEVAEVISRMHATTADALWMKLGMDDVGGKGATSLEIADALGIMVGRPDATRRKAVGALLSEAKAEAHAVAKDLGIDAPIKGAWLAEAVVETKPPAGPSWHSLIDRFGSEERVRIYTAAITAGRAAEVAAILEREAKQQATPAESRMVRQLRAEIERRQALLAFQQHAKTRPVSPAEAHDLNPYGAPSVALVPGYQHTGRGPGGETVTVNVGGEYVVQDDPAKPHPRTGADWPVQFAVAMDPVFRRIRTLQAMYQQERAIPPGATQAQREKLLARGPQPRKAHRQERKKKAPAKSKRKAQKSLDSIPLCIRV